jgi:peptide methionine sulfoxide reductase MsrA
MGGTGSFPIYDNYTHNNTFSETLRLEFDQSTTSYSQLLDAYWRYVPPGSSCYDPAYCPRIFFVDGEQEKAARASLAAHNSTVEELQILPASEFVFWKAEEVHQQYNKKMGFPCGTALTGCSQRKR